MIKIDLHTHSTTSIDGAITKQEYQYMLDQKKLDCIAITDHNETKFARGLHKEMGKQIIVGEEITTRDGEMIGLFLQETVPPGLSAQETAKAIHKQGGLVYIPHPFETLRKGIQQDVLALFASEIDIIETFNGRGRLRGKANQAEEFAQKYQLARAASSDAHGVAGLGKTYSTIADFPTRDYLQHLLQNGQLQKAYAPLWTFLYPAFNKLKKKL